MRWLHMIIMIMVVAACLILVGAKQITDMDANTNNVGTEKQEPGAINAAPYEKSPVKLKKLIDTHRLFHKKIKITFASLVDDLKPYLESGDISQLNEILGTTLDQYNDDINKADEALLANNIELTDNLLMKAAKELENIYIAQEMIINFKQEIAPQAIPAIEQKNNKIII